MTQTGFTPTGEQEKARELFATGKSLAIEAGAGTGKTATLKLLAQDADKAKRRGQYIAFNKAIVTEAGAKMPPNVACSTAHSLAYRSVVPGTRFGDRLRNSRRMKSTEIADRLAIDAIRIQLPEGQPKNLARSYLAGVAMRGVTRFCQSADPEPDRQHVPFIDGIDLPKGTARSYPNNDLVAKALVPAMRKAWKDLTSETGQLPFKHDHYLKMWQLSDPKINADFILFDEAQDANPVLVDIVRQQEHAQLVWVGDSQQQIYTFTGAVNALQQVGAEQVAYLSQSFRFGEDIADVANEVLSRLPDAQLRLSGTPTIESKIDALSSPKVVLCRTNARAVRHLLDSIKDGKRPHIVGGGREVLDFAKAAASLMETGFTAHPELACFDTWAEVQEYVEQDEQGGDLRLLVSLVDEFGVETITEALEKMPREDRADVVISTAHKSKGREWDTVLIADDFPADPKGEELRLLYVAVTRAKLVLDITNVFILNEDGPAVEAVGFEPLPELTARIASLASLEAGPDLKADVPAEVQDGHGEAPVGSEDTSEPMPSGEERTDSRADLYRDAVAWIAFNDEPEADLDTMAELISVVMTADLYGKTARQVAGDVIRQREGDGRLHGGGTTGGGDWVCSCGRKIHGNAAASSHMRAHERRGQEATWL